VPSPAFELKNEILRAGAGAGKTTRLVEEFVRVYDLFKKETDTPPKIIVTTFTRKATHELKERLLQKAMQRNDLDLFTFVSQKSRVHISTIHGILALFLRQQGPLMGLSPDFKLVSESEDLRTRKKLLKKIFSQNEKFLQLFEDYKIKEILLALDLAGEVLLTGGNFKSVNRAQMEKDCVEILCEKIRTILDSSNQILQENPPESWVRFLQDLGRLKTISWKDFFAGLSDLKTTMSALGRKPSYSKAKPPFDSVLNEVWSEQLKDLKDFIDDPFWNSEIWEKWFQNQTLFDELARQFLTELAEIKIDSSRLRMGDLEILSARLIQEHPESASFFSKDWDYWMIDEYQDTSPLQVYLLQNLIQNRPQFIVGDPQQSIYLFRGARSEVFEEKSREFEKSKAIVSEKMDNYRSRAPVLYLINEIFTKMSPQFKAMIPQKDWESSFVPCEILIASPNEDENIAASDLELHLVVEKIAALLESSVPAEKIAVLSRTNRRLDELGEIAKKNGLSYQQPSAAGYFLKREIKDAASILKFLLNPHDDEHLISCLRSPWFFLADEDLVLAAQKKTNSLWSSLLSVKNKKEFKNEASEDLIEKMVQALDDAKTKGVSQALVDLLIARGLFDTAEQIDPSGRREANLWKFVTSIKEKERLGGFHYLDFLSDLEALNKSEDEGEAVPVIQPQRVNFMTVHASKGLQFDHVLLLGLSQDPQRSNSSIWSFNEKRQSWSLAMRSSEDQKWIYSPQVREQTDLQRDKELLESERLFYVALTRAKESITLVMNDKIKSQSWAAKMFMDLSEGTHDREKYRYSVKKYKNFPEIRNLNSNFSKNTKSKERSKFVFAEMENTSVKTVTSMLDAPASEKAVKDEPQYRINRFDLLKKSQFGTDLHKVFESLKYRSVEDLLKLSSENDLKETLGYLQTLSKPPIFDLIQAGHVEFGFEVIDGSEIMRGQIDLWGKLGNQVWIVDYKTGSSAHVEKAFQQLKMYSEALNKIHRWGAEITVQLCVLYPLQKEIFIRPS